MVKQNIISGLLLFCISIVLGPYMMRGLQKEEAQVAANTELREAFGALSAARKAADSQSTTEQTEAATPLDVATARAATAHVNYAFAGFRKSHITMTHAHGNLQGMFNILVGLFLARIAINRWQMQIISWGMIAGSWIMVGALMLGNMFGQRWAFQAIASGGTVLILALFALTLAVIIKGFKEDNPSLTSSS
ncbi:hypothetical protein [Kordiimonas aquimaris]|uniref:hypothetical protein n=1 Tax=Kordiimonas aquimaris TaxID=707591 RepID=UPI0021D00A35|nr:hypothetical protein [Kordiimonas aquimaris]